MESPRKTVVFPLGGGVVWAREGRLANSVMARIKTLGLEVKFLVPAEGNVCG
jgi:hypothetical protein